MKPTRICYVNSEGEVVSIANLTTLENHIEGQEVNGLFAYKYPYDQIEDEMSLVDNNLNTFHNNYYYDNGWQRKPTKPNQFYHWINREWVFMPEVFMNTIRSKRNYLLNESDWTQSNDSPLSDAQRVAWANYRQSLRDMPEVYANETDINNVVWPERP